MCSNIRETISWNQILVVSSLREKKQKIKSSSEALPAPCSQCVPAVGKLNGIWSKFRGIMSCVYVKIWIVYTWTNCYFAPISDSVSWRGKVKAAKKDGVTRDLFLGEKSASPALFHPSEMKKYLARSFKYFCPLVIQQTQHFLFIPYCKTGCLLG